MNQIMDRGREWRMSDFERFAEASRWADRVANGMAIAFLAFVAGCFAGYLWMAHAYGMLP